MSTALTIEWVDMPGKPEKVYLAIAQVVYGVPSIALMFFLLIFLGVSKKYSTSFYRLVQVDLLTNMVCWINTWISLRSSEFPFGTTYTRFLLRYIPWIWNLSSLAINVFFHMQFLSAASMSIHRISAILFYNHYERFWSRYYFLIALLFFVCSWIPQVLIPGENTRMELVNGTTLFFTFDMVHIVNIKNVVNYCSVLYFLLLIGIATTVSAVAAKRFRGTETHSNVSKKLTRIALTYGFVYSGILFWNIWDNIQTKFEIFPPAFWNISVAMLSVASDLMTLALPYILLIFDSNIKRDLRQPKKEATNTSVMIVSS